MHRGGDRRHRHSFNVICLQIWSLCVCADCPGPPSPLALLGLCKRCFCLVFIHSDYFHSFNSVLLFVCVLCWLFVHVAATMACGKWFKYVQRNMRLMHLGSRIQLSSKHFSGVSVFFILHDYNFGFFWLATQEIVTGKLATPNARWEMSNRRHSRSHINRCCGL